MRKARIACILMSKFNDFRLNPAMNEREKCCEEALELLDEAGGKKVDIALLCETFPSGRSDSTCETFETPIILAVRKLARKHHMHVVAPVMERTDDGTTFNSAMLIGRNGEIIDSYHKHFPFWCEAGVTPGTECPVFDLDFGRLGITICFDSQFPDAWMNLGDQGAELVLWPSAYSGGRKLQAAAIYNNYYVVSCTVIPPDTTVVDITGDILFRAQGAHQVIVHELDLDRTMVHDNFNGDKLAQMRRDFGDRVKMQYLHREGWWIVESSDPHVSVKQELKARGIEPLQEYTRRSRREISRLRAARQPLPESVEAGMSA